MYPTSETLEREISYLLSNQSLSDSSDIDPITVVSIDAGKFARASKGNVADRSRKRIAHNRGTYQHRGWIRPILRKTILEEILLPVVVSVFAYVLEVVY